MLGIKKDEAKKEVEKAEPKKVGGEPVVATTEDMKAKHEELVEKEQSAVHELTEGPDTHHNLLPEEPVALVPDQEAGAVEAVPSVQTDDVSKEEKEEEK